MRSAIMSPSPLLSSPLRTQRNGSENEVTVTKQAKNYTIHPKLTSWKTTPTDLRQEVQAILVYENSFEKKQDVYCRHVDSAFKDYLEDSQQERQEYYRTKRREGKEQTLKEDMLKQPKGNIELDVFKERLEALFPTDPKLEKYNQIIIDKKEEEYEAKMADLHAQHVQEEKRKALATVEKPKTLEELVSERIELKNEIKDLEAEKVAILSEQQKRIEHIHEAIRALGGSDLIPMKDLTLKVHQFETNGKFNQLAFETLEQEITDYASKHQKLVQKGGQLYFQNKFSTLPEAVKYRTKIGSDSKATLIRFFSFLKQLHTHPEKESIVENFKQKHEIDLSAFAIEVQKRKRGWKEGLIQELFKKYGIKSHILNDYWSSSTSGQDVNFLPEIHAITARQEALEKKLGVRKKPVIPGSLSPKQVVNNPKINSFNLAIQKAGGEDQIPVSAIIDQICLLPEYEGQSRKKIQENFLKYARGLNKVFSQAGSSGYIYQNKFSTLPVMRTQLNKVNTEDKSTLIRFLSFLKHLHKHPEKEAIVENFKQTQAIDLSLFLGQGITAQARDYFLKDFAQKVGLSFNTLKQHFPSVK